MLLLQVNASRQGIWLLPPRDDIDIQASRCAASRSFAENSSLLRKRKGARRKLSSGCGRIFVRLIGL
jgi:hypothetical protein